LLEFDRFLSKDSAHRIVASESQKLSAVEQQRDVFESHRHRVFAVGYYMTSNELEAEEILTETFVTAFSRQKQPDAHGVDKALLSELERRFSLEQVEAASPDANLILAKTATHRTDMEEALALLPPSERLVFLLKDVEGYSAAKIATLLDLPEADVQRTILSARIRMRNALAAAHRLAEEQQSVAELEAAQVEGVRHPPQASGELPAF
jgi:RNA polymerase sigma-70 factor (ECF subfamily)